MFKEELNRLIDIIDENLKREFENRGSYQESIFGIMEYSLFTGGKRLRPAMALKSCELFSNDMENGIPFAMAIEMIHTYSLVHDDLPSMDNDDFRRGKPTSHKKFSEGMAILSGDGLLNMAFEVVLNKVENLDNPSLVGKYIRALKEIGRYSGVYGMIGGQVVDLKSDKDGDEMTTEKLIFMYETKTAALIQAALVSGAIVGSASDEEIEIMREFGYNLGIAYQVRDDILDLEEDREINKFTYASFFGLEKALEAVEDYSDRAIKSLDKLKTRDTSFFREMTDVLVNRSK